MLIAHFALYCKFIMFNGRFPCRAKNNKSNSCSRVNRGSDASSCSTASKVSQLIQLVPCELLAQIWWTCGWGGRRGLGKTDVIWSYCKFILIRNVFRDVTRITILNWCDICRLLNKGNAVIKIYKLLINLKNFPWFH